MAFLELGKIKRRIFKGVNFQVVIAVKIRDVTKDELMVKMTQKIKLKNGMVTLTYNPTNYISIESTPKNSEEKEYISFSLDDYIEIIENFSRALKFMETKDIFHWKENGGLKELFVDKELQKECTIAVNSYASNLLIIPEVVSVYGETYEGFHLRINNGRKIEIPYYELEKLTKLLTKTDIMVLAEQMVTNGILLDNMEKEVTNIQTIIDRTSKVYDNNNRQALYGD